MIWPNIYLLRDYLEMVGLKSSPKTKKEVPFRHLPFRDWAIDRPVH